MKKSIYFLMTITAALFTSCEPMDDIYNEVDATLEADQNAGNAAYTLTDEDFATATKDGGLGFDRTYFVSVQEANDSLPKWLDERYPQFGDGSIANITMEIAEPIAPIGETTEYEVTEQDYTDNGHKYGNFDDPGQILAFLEGKFPALPNGDVVELTYIYYEGKASTLTNSFLKIDDAWTMVTLIEGEDYQAMGEAYSNFDNRNEATQKISVYLNQLYPFAMEGDTKNVVFKVHVGGGDNETYLKTFRFDGHFWQATFVQTLQFGHNGVAWEPDNTIIHTLTPEDFAFIGEVFEEKGGEYENPAWSAGNYSNFDRRLGNQNYWSDAMLLEAMNVLLNERVAPDAAEGQKYLMRFDIYNNADGVEEMAVIKQGGVWVLQ